MRRHINRVDANQRALTALWRRMGVTVWITSALGTGVDVVLGLKTLNGAPINLLVEIKDGKKVPSAQKLTQEEEKFHEMWNGQVAIVRSEEEAMNLIHKARGIDDVEFRMGEDFGH